MSAMGNTTLIVTIVTKTATKEKTPNGAEAASRVNILDLCEEHYEDILPVMDKIHRDKRKEVHTRLDFRENSRKSRRMREDSQNSSAKTLSARYRNPSERPQIRDRLRNNDGNVFGRLGHRMQSAFKRLSDTYSPSTTKSGTNSEYSRDGSYSRGRHKRVSSPSRDRPQSRDRSHGIKESYAGGKDRPPMLAPGNYVQWKSRIKRYIDTKHNHELIHYCLKNPPYKFMWADKEVLISEGIDNDIYSTFDASSNACEMWKAIERLKHGESINVQDLETNFYWEFRKFTSLDGESLESYYSKFYKMMNELVRNQCDVTNHQVNVQFLLQLQP
nr:hypothetical protein [Tanacetum cinerariifolium]